MKGPKVKALLIDLSGTLHIGNEATPGAVAALERLQAAKVPIRLCSNTTKESKNSLLARLENIGFQVDGQDLYTSLTAVRSLVEKRSLKPLLLLSDSACEDFPPSVGERDSVVVGLAPEKLGYKDLNQAFHILSGEGRTKSSPSKSGTRGPVLIATHKALYYRDDAGRLSLGPGGFVTALEEASGTNAEVVGKPSKSFFELCLESLQADNVNKEDWPHVAMIGDDWKNDLGGGAIELGLRRFLVKTGKYRSGDENRIEGTGFSVFNNFAEIVDEILQDNNE